MTQIHATCLEIKGVGILLTGPSGSGKSDLALRLTNDGAHLVADDRVDIRQEKGLLIANAPENLKDLLEVRGIGIIQTQTLASTPLGLVFKLVPADEIDRLPEEETETILDVSLPAIKIAPFEISAPQKIQLAVDVVSGVIVRKDD